MEYQSKIKKILEEVRLGVKLPEEALEELSELPYMKLGDDVKLDLHRSIRKGVGEIIYCAGKSEDQIRKIALSLSSDTGNAAFSRMSIDQADIVSEIIPEFEYFPIPGMGILKYHDPEPRGRVALLAAGSSDLPAAEEAARTAEFLGCTVERHYDVGVAGLHRLLDIMPRIREADSIVVAAGMDGALPSVVAGLVRTLVIALPTSVGYGTCFGGVSALLAMLNSCSTGIVVVNIDNGVGAGVAASLVAGKLNSPGA
ncbi:MAG: nickel pincer cofactor biosynthesis protein LarB [Synergistales bacterium]|nr:nickel pincer cofactor biosynthesis protein LarB [Synergistales bacterium]